MRKISLFILLLSCFCFAQAQTLVTIQQIQGVAPADLAACKDSSSLVGQQVKVRGVVVTPYGLAVSGAGTSNLNNIWIQTGNGGFNGLDIFASSTDPGLADLQSLTASGDSVEIVGTVAEFGPSGGPQVETELISIQSATLLGSGNVKSKAVNLGDLNDNLNANVLPTGEQWEGQFIELINVEVTAVSYFSNNTRVSFTVKDNAGNLINVSDRFRVQKLPAAGGTFVPPTVGAVYDTLKGIVMHSPNGCKNFTGRGYELHPFDVSHYVISSSPPQISNIQVNPIAPSSSQQAVVSATITDPDGVVVSATLYYAVGAANTSYTAVPMTASGTTYTANIPAQSSYSFVKYYICAVDDSALTACNPNVPGSVNPLAYVVRDGGLTIYDLQYTPFTDGNSIYRDKSVTVTGIVTASAEANNLGYVFIQQEGGLQGWAGIMCVGSSQLANLTVGNKVTMTGDVKESFGHTRLENITAVNVLGSGTVTPLNLNPNVFSTYSFATNEQYEGMLIRLANTAGKLFVIDKNADFPSNFGEYRVGADVLLPDEGCRILAGRQTSSTYSSLNVSYVNDSSWAIVDGIMNAPLEVVNVGNCMDAVTGIMYYGFSNMKLLPRNNADFEKYDSNCDGFPNGIADDLKNKGILRTYPSPSSDILNVQFDFGSPISADISLIDITGRVVANHNIEGETGEIQISTRNLAEGVYVLRLSYENKQVITQKVLIAR